MKWFHNSWSLLHKYLIRLTSFSFMNFTRTDVPVYFKLPYNFAHVVIPYVYTFKQFSEIFS